MEDQNSYIAYTDSGFHIGRNEGAYAFILLHDGEIVHKESRRFRRNTDLFARWHSLIRSKHIKVKVTKIRAHSGDVYNEMCDELCCETAAAEMQGQHSYLLTK